MGNENGEWILHGPDWNSPGCLHSAEEAAAFIREVGFLPLFRNEIEGFSLEEHTDPAYWWSDDPERDPWTWRTELTAGRRVAYGKFFDGKAGFVSLEWFPGFVNCRRDGYGFSVRYEEGKAPYKHRRIMDCFPDPEGENDGFACGEEQAGIISYALKKAAGFGKGGEKGFDGAVTALMMQTYLCYCDFRKHRDKMGREYGWAAAVYATPEQLWGSDAVNACDGEDTEVSRERIYRFLSGIYPGADERKLKRLIQ